jgi:hypothetical protein
MIGKSQKGYLGDIVVDGKIILNLVLERWNVKMTGSK